MKVSKWVDFGQEIEVEIGAEDVKCALAEAFGRVATKIRTLEIYDTLREMHGWLKPVRDSEQEFSEEIKNAINAVDSVLYMAEAILVSEHIKEQLPKED